MDFLKTIGGLLMGPGALEDNPIDTFKMYAAPGLAEVLSPDQQAAYGKQIQTAMRRINANTRPNFVQMQNSVNQGLMNKVELDQKLRDLRFQETIDKKLSGAGQDPGAQAYRVPGLDVTPGGESIPPMAAAGQIAPSGPASANQRKAQVYREIGDMWAARDSTKADKYYAIADRLDPRPSYGTPIEMLDSNGNPVMVQPDGLGGFRQVQGFQPKQPMPDYLDAFVALYKRRPDPNNAQDMAEVDRLARISRPPTQINNTNNLNGPQTKGEEAYWKELGSRLPELEGMARAANRTNQSLQDLITLGNKKTFTGLMAPGAIGAAQFLQSFGLNPAEDTLSNSRTFQAAANVLVLDFMGAMGGARGFSKEESAILYDAFPKIIDDPKARERIARMLIARNNRIIEEYNSAKSQFESGMGKKLPGGQFTPLTPSGGAGWSIRPKGK